MVDRSDDASCLLGLEGLAVERVVRTVLGVKIVQLVTDDPDAARCPSCAMVSTSGKDWVLTRPRDLPCGGEFAVVQWRKRRWRCRTVGCPRGSFTEQVAQVPAGMRTTTRLRTALAVAVEDGRDQSEVAAAHGVSWPTVQRAVVALGAIELVEPEPTTVLGMDETRFGRPRWLPEGHHDDGRVRWRRTDPWETGFVDITGDQSLLGQVDGRTSAAVQAWLAARTPEFRAAVEVVVIDPHAGYAAAVRQALPDAAIAVDHFHLIMLANKAVTAVRQRVTRDLLGRRGRRSTQHGPTAGCCCAAVSGSPTGRWHGCGTAASITTRPGRSCRHGSRRRNCARCARPPLAAGTATTSVTGSGGSTGGAPTPISRS